MRFWVGLLYTCIGLGGLGGGVWYFRSVQLSLSEPHCAVTDLTDPADKKSIVVAITGAVKNPGVVYIQSDQRLADALSLAGGLDSAADIQYLNQKLNLAQKISDGDHVYIPFANEGGVQDVVGEKSMEGSGSGSGSGGDAAVSDASSLISLNAASTQQLQLLAGIGEKRAEDIIAARPYSSLEEIVTKAVLTQKIFDAIKKDIKL